MKSIERLKLELANNVAFYRAYKDAVNKNRSSAGNGSSVSVQRRSIIGTHAHDTDIRGGLNMITMVTLEKYFNERWNLCPYGLDNLVTTQNTTTTNVIVDDDTVETKTKETIMSFTPNSSTPVEVVTFIYGSPAKDVSDSEIFNHIARLERDIFELEKIRTKPKKLVARIDALNDEIATLVELVDAR